MSEPTTITRDRHWYVVGRWQELDGESRVNLFRILAIGAFYLIQVAHFYGFADRQAGQPFHRAATAVAATWITVGLAIMVCLRKSYLPAALKFVSTLFDALLLTVLAALGGKANSPLVFAYFLILAFAALRFNLVLLWSATVACVAGYISLVGLTDNTWFDQNHSVEPVEQGVVVLSLASTGVLLEQLVRRSRSLAEEYARRVGTESNR